MAYRRHLSYERLILNILHKSPHLTKPQVEEYVKKIMDIMIVALLRGYKIKLEDIGTFQIIRKRYTWDWTLKQHRVWYRNKLKFSAAQTLRRDMNYKQEDDLDEIFKE